MCASLSGVSNAAVGCVLTGGLEETAMRGERLVRRVGMVAGAALLTAAVVVGVAGSAGASTVTSEAAFRAAWANASVSKIDLGANVTLTCGAGGLALRNSPTALTLDGHGHTLRQTCANNGVLAQNGVGGVQVANVMITGGAAPVDGGAISTSSAPVAVANSTISGNTAGSEGGAIGESSGNVTITNSTISGNAASGAGGPEGGAIRESSGNVTITNSTISGNAASGAGGPEGGAIRESSGNVTITNSTISGNAASGAGGAEGGAIRESSGNVTITNSTISGNAASGAGGAEGGAVQESFGTVTLVYATVAQNSAPTGANLSGSTATTFGSVVAIPVGGGVNCAAVATTTHGHNFSDDGSCGFSAGTDKQSAGSPKLGALAANGGTTQTRLPQSGSPLIDAIPIGSCQADGAAGITTDQRGLARPAQSGCDIGAVEAQPATQGVRTASRDGNVYDFGTDISHGSLKTLGISPAQPIVGITSTSSHGGYWLVGADGSVYAFGNATFHGSLKTLGITPSKPIVGIAATPSGGGYWLVGADGGIFGFGNAAFHGSLPGSHITPAQPIVGIAATPSGGGYWLVGTDGGIFALGNATFHGSLPGAGGAASPVVGIEPTSTATGYWLAETNGTHPNFGTASNLANATPSASVSSITG